jgi:hypothetical protein
MQRSSPVDAGRSPLDRGARQSAAWALPVRRSKTELSLRPKMHFFVAQAQKACLFVAQPCAMHGYLSSHSLERLFSLGKPPLEQHSERPFLPLKWRLINYPAAQGDRGACQTTNPWIF